MLRQFEFGFILSGVYPIGALLPFLFFGERRP